MADCGALFVLVCLAALASGERLPRKPSVGPEREAARTVLFQDLIRKKRDGLKLSDEDIRVFIQKVVNHEAEDSQIGAMLMAIFLKGLDYEETWSLARSMLESGDKLDWGEEWRPLLVDKHSTGGVGDKVSLSLAPALAACGLKVPMMSGRGLEFTGGTLDKLESIPGFQTKLSVAAMRAALEDPGCFIIGSNEQVNPANGELYKVRDVTATVNYAPLTISSIVSQKVAEGTNALVMDVKVGEAAFLQTVEEASELARMIIAVAARMNVTTKAVLTRMSVPIGRAVGNALEVLEAIESMQGRGPEDLDSLVSVLGGVLLEMSGKAASVEHGQDMILAVLRDGSALRAFRKMLVRQGVSEEFAEDVCRDPRAFLPRVPANHTTAIAARTTGVVKDIAGLPIAQASLLLGAGRQTANQIIDSRVGIMLDDKLAVGAAVAAGDTLLVAHHAEHALPDQVRDLLQGSVLIAPPGEHVDKPPRDRVIKILS